jgi:hypothetical protein
MLNTRSRQILYIHINEFTMAERYLDDTGAHILAYETWKKVQVLPESEFAEENIEIDNLYIFKSGREYELGDIIIWNGYKTEVVKAENLNQITYNPVTCCPIGIIMIPSSHNVYGTGEAMMASITQLRPTNPEIGAAFGENIDSDLGDHPWSSTAEYNSEFDSWTEDVGYELRVAFNYEGLVFNSTVRTAVRVKTTSVTLDLKTGYSIPLYLPSDLSYYDVANTAKSIDETVKYGAEITEFSDSNGWYCMSPYGSDGISKNSNYSPNIVYASTGFGGVGKPYYNAFADFGGYANTQALIDAVNTAHPEYEGWQSYPHYWDPAWTHSHTAESSYQEPKTNPMDFGHDFNGTWCSWRFHTPGTNKGDWYVPALGELGYMFARFGVYNTITNAINEWAGKTIAWSLYSGNNWAHLNQSINAWGKHLLCSTVMYKPTTNGVQKCCQTGVSMITGELKRGSYNSDGYTLSVIIPVTRVS